MYPFHVVMSRWFLTFLNTRGWKIVVLIAIVFTCLLLFFLSYYWFKFNLKGLEEGERGVVGLQASSLSGVCEWLGGGGGGEGLYFPHLGLLLCPLAGVHGTGREPHCFEGK